MFDWLGISAVNPWLLIGAAGVAAPIIIHLLSKRRFKRIDWAAMDFLLDADRRNRRRIRLEHLLLLLLRCLAILLLAMLVSRLFIKPGGLASFALQSVRTERLVLLDDSPSMQVRNGDRSVFDQTIEALSDFVRATASQRPNDTFSLMLTSRPGRFVVNGRLFSQTEEILQGIAALKPADLSANPDASLAAVADAIEQPTGGAGETLNRVVYLLSDLRSTDWMGDPSDPDSQALDGPIERLSELVEGLVVVNVGASRVDNLAVASIGSQVKNVVVGVPTRFDVTVANHGAKAAQDVAVTFTVAGAPPAEALIRRIPAGESGQAGFDFTFREAGSAEILVEIDSDRLPVDNRRHFAARVMQAVPILVVDGDPAGEFGRSESFFLSYALSPPGEVPSGYGVQTITENQFIAADLAPYQVIVLANVYRISAQQRDRLEQWVERGGGLVLALGDQVDRQSYNSLLHREGKGLLPIRLNEVAGDPDERQSARLVVDRANHPILKVFAGESNPFLQRIRFYQWWSGEMPTELVASGDGRVIASFNDTARSPALAERRFGDGRVLTMTMPVDGDWHSWPADPSYIITVLETARYLAGSTAMQGNLTVGQPVRHPLNVARFATEADFLAPGQERPTTLRAREDGTHGEAANMATTGVNGRPVFQHDLASSRGIYQLMLHRYDGEQERVLFAANLDPDESDLTPLDRAAAEKIVHGENVTLVEGAAVLAGGVTGGRAEMWRWMLAALVLVLCADSFLAWTFGRRR